MKRVFITRFEFGFSDPEVCDGRNQVYYTDDEAEAHRRMNQLHTDFLAHLKTRTDIEHDRIEDRPNEGGANFKVIYPIPSTDSQGTPGFFLWRKAYFWVRPADINFELVEQGDVTLFEFRM
jgi:hypothetical protein